jgi:hypothetical protein
MSIQKEGTQIDPWPKNFVLARPIREKTVFLLRLNAKNKRWDSLANRQELLYL